MKRGVVWDTSAILSFIDADDCHHDRAREVAASFVEERRPSLVTNYIVAETHALLLRRLGRSVAREWLLSDPLPVVRVTIEHEERARSLLLRFADKDWSFCDALTFAVIESDGLQGAFSFDHHFKQHGRFKVWGLER